uniref:Uncharacterized protein n=1 Tax=Arundo donax TaxID=35708 RepID=A0A0A9BR80_ARUDO
MRLTAIGVPRQFAFKISPKEPFPMITAFVKSNSSGLISQSALFVSGGGIDFGSKWLPVFPYVNPPCSMSSSIMACLLAPSASASGVFCHRSWALTSAPLAMRHSATSCHPWSAATWSGVRLS